MLRNGLLRYILYTCPKVWKPSCSKCSSTEWAASVHTLHIPKGVKTFVFKVLQKGLLRYIFYACPKLWWRSCSKWYGMGCFGTYFTHAQSCDNVRFQRATEWTASVNTLHMPKSVITFVFIMLRNTCPNLSCDNVFKVLRNGRLRYILHTCPKVGKPSCSKCYRKDCFSTELTHAQSFDNVRVHSATQWTASVHTLHMPEASQSCDILCDFVFKVLRNGLLRYITYTCPKLW